MTQRFSQNGWKAYEGTSTFTRFTAGGRGWWAANADVATVLAEWISWYDREIERVVFPGEIFDDWSHAFRAVRGQITGLSNHASATAVDVNSTRHPRGVRKTFTAAQYAKMRAKINSPEMCDDQGRPVLRLGAFFSAASTVDDMHAEINANAARVAQAARKIRALSAPVKQEEPEVELDDKVKLSAAAAAAMSTASTKRKEGDEVTLSYILQWGGAGGYRTWKDVIATKSAVSSLVGTVAALESTVAALVGAIKGGSTLTAAQITAASQAGAEAALKKLGQELVD